MPIQKCNFLFVQTAAFDTCVESNVLKWDASQVSGSPTHSVFYKGYWDCIRSMSRREGLGAFYRGAGVNALRIIPAAAVQFTTYDMLKYALLALDPSAASPL